MKRALRSCSALVAISALLQPALVPVASAQSAQSPAVILQPNATADVAPYLNNPANDPVLSSIEQQKLITLLRQKVKYVFVIFQENRSFDHEFGTFPGANGLYSDGVNQRSAANTPGFTQTYTDNATGKTVTVNPFLIGPAQTANAITSVDHSHAGLAKKLHVDAKNVAHMDQFSLDEYQSHAGAGGAANEASGTQYARLVMSHIDCDTIPFYWKWASRFTLFDNIFATEDGPSTPNAIAMLSGQSGETQWVKHGSKGTSYTVGSHSGTTEGAPFLGDNQPFPGSQFDPVAAKDKQPQGSTGSPSGNSEFYGDTNISSNLTYASLPLTFLGAGVSTALAKNLNPSADLADIQKDIPFIAANRGTPVNWRWYQEGYDLEPTDTTAVASHASYISHHNGPQYFGYISDTPGVSSNMRGLGDFFTDAKNGALPASGVFYIRGGYTNLTGQKPPITTPGMSAAEQAAILKNFQGDDDHASYSDSQLSQAMAARAINLIAGNPALWAQSAIIITYDESDGFYDHVPPRILSYGPDGLPASRGVRVPLILISPYARAHATSRVEGDHNAIIETINTIFNLPALSSLPDEAAALAAGNSPAFNQFGPSGFQQKYLGPRDTNSAITDSLLSGFDPKRLLGTSPPLPASLAQIDPSILASLPLYNGAGCSAIGITTLDRQLGIPNVIPAHFNPRPGQYPANN